MAFRYIVALLLSLTCAEASKGKLVHRRQTKPHVIFFLADDYGWGNIGFHRALDEQVGSQQARAEVQTPNLDRLIREGILLDRAYSYKICSPARSSLQSGRLANHVNTKNVNVNHQNAHDPISGYAGIPTNMTGLASKMQEGGYNTHFIGKWDAGMAHPLQTPLQKGYQSFFGYFQHANDHWQKGMPFQSTGEIDKCLNRWVDFSMYNKSYRGGVNLQVASEYGCFQDPGRFTQNKDMLHGLYNATGCALNGSSICLMEECYEEAMFLRRGLRVIDDYAIERQSNSSSNPLFLFYAFHALHTPLQVPQSFLSEIDRLAKQNGGKPIGSRQRRLYAAMVLYMDSVVGNMTRKLKDVGMWDDTILIFSSDNGGPLYEPAAANNYPLRGGKFSDFEGGVRVNAFVAGGHNVIPVKNRGTVFTGIVSIADWYATLSEIAGVDPFDYAANKTNAWLAARKLPTLPEVDGVSQWQFILNGTNARPGPLQLSAHAILKFPYKLIIGRQPYSMWQGPLFPNCTTVRNMHQSGPFVEDMQIFNAQLRLSPFQSVQDRLTQSKYCGDGCLFNVETDPGEHHDLAENPDSFASAKLKELQDLLQKANLKNFEPDRGTEVFRACEVQSSIGGFFGPFVDTENFYSPVHMSPVEKNETAKLMAKLRRVNRIEHIFETPFDEIMKLMPLRRLMDHQDLDQCLARGGVEFDVPEVIV